MNVVRKGFPSIPLDNDETYFAHLTGVIESVDELAEMEVTRTPEKYHFRIVTSLPKYNQLLLAELLKLNTLFKIRLDLSKSIKSSGTIAFDININN